MRAAVPPHVIDKGIPTTGLLAQVLVAKYSDHLPLYRQERIFARAGLAIAQSTLGAWVGACGVRLQPLVDALREEVLQQAVLHAETMERRSASIHRSLRDCPCTCCKLPTPAGSSSVRL